MPPKSLLLPVLPSRLRSFLWGSFCIAAVLIIGWGGAASAQGINLGGDGGPIEILADNGIEWIQDSKKVIARGNASATRGDTKVTADTLIAWYREKAGAKPAAEQTEQAGAESGMGGSSEIYKLEADGSVVISSPTQSATGSHAVYDVDTSKLVLTNTSGPVTMVTPKEKVVAEKTLEYDTTRKVATATGGATAYQGDKTLRGDTLVALMEEVDGKSAIRTMRAIDNVVITSPKETARGSQGNYDAKTGIAILTGSVTITRGEDVLTGTKAVVNMKTGVSTLYGGGGPEAGGRARAVLVPEKKNDQTGAGTSGTGKGGTVSAP